MTSTISLTNSDPGPGVTVSAGRAAALFRAERSRIYRETDQLFVSLLLLEWATLIIVDLVVAPESGASKSSAATG